MFGPILAPYPRHVTEFEKNGTTQYFTEVKADFVGLDVARTASRFTRIPMEPRDTEQQDQVDDPGVEAGPGEAAEGSPSGDRQPSWDPADGEPTEAPGIPVAVLVLIVVIAAVVGVSWLAFRRGPSAAV